MSAGLLTIIVPTLNEADNIQPLLERISEETSGTLGIEVLFVDDGSTDETCERILLFAQTHPVRLLRREHPTGGLAGAVLAGAAAANSRWILVMDGDLSHPPDRISDLVAPLLDGSQDMVVGSRYVPGGRTPGWPWWRRLMSRVACWLARPLTRLRDPLSGFFATDRARLLACKSDAAGFKIALELIANAPPGFRVKEIPIVFRDRERGESKVRLSVLITYLFQLVVLLARRAIPFGHSRSAPLPEDHARAEDRDAPDANSRR
ncbi:MAG: dolichol-phosphate mannosyltransferase [Verrucomicrobiota bacterium]|jgi:dolichol-phosphate mannosyltransferase